MPAKFKFPVNTTSAGRTCILFTGCFPAMTNHILEPKRYRFRRTNQVFVFHHLSNCDQDKLVEEWKRLDEKRRRRRQPLYRRQFLIFHVMLTEHRQKLREMMDKSLVTDVGEAKQWYWVMEKFPFNFEAVKWRANELRLRNLDRRLALEALEWIFCSERQGYLNFLNGKYFTEEKRQIEKLIRIPVKKHHHSMQKELTKPDILICSQIRLFFENRLGLIFQLEELEKLKDATAKDWKNLLIKQINQFTRDIHQNFMANVPKKENKKKMFEITLLQETTKAAFHSIQAYQRVLQKSKQCVIVDCTIVDNRLFFNTGHIKEQFKAPITALSRIEWARFSPEDIDNMAERCSYIISTQLDSEKLSQHPSVVEFAATIADEKIGSLSEEGLLEIYRRTKWLLLKLKKVPEEISSQLFRIKMSAVWTLVQQRLRQMLQMITMRVRKGFMEDLQVLQEEFRRYDRALLFRSINPALMLANKAIVDQILTEKIIPSVKKLVALYDRIFVLTQQISLDPNQHDLLIALAAYRMALPQQIKEHEHFFNKRLSSFQFFVTKKQAVVMSNAQKVGDRIKILQTMANPQEAEIYKKEVISLIVPLDELIQEIDDLNKFEEVIGVPKTEVPRMRQIATDVRVMEQLFERTKEYYDHMNEFFESRRTVVNIPNSRHFLDDYLAQLAKFESQLPTQRAARHFIVNARNDVDVFKKNFAVAEVLSCKRFLDQHWTKMSEIVGFDLSLHTNSTMAVICELGLDDVLAQLKPIAFAAEREALVSDQLDMTIGHWTKAHIETRTTPYWNLELPSNLLELIVLAENHKSLLMSSNDAENAFSQLSYDINHWLGIITKLSQLFTKWNSLVEDWLRVARIFKYAKDTLQSEYLQFRRCAKLWRRFELALRQDSTALHLLELKHVSCWLTHVEEHMKVVVKGVHKHLSVIRLANPRLCLTSDHDLLQLFAATSIAALEAFPQLSRLCFNSRGQLEIADVFGTELVLDTVSCENCETLPVETFIKLVEKSFLEKICELLQLEINERICHIPKMITVLGEILGGKMVGDALGIVRMENEFYLQNKFNQSQTRLSLDFIQLDEQRKLASSLCTNWSRGSFLLLSGQVRNARTVCQAVAQKLFSSVRYINCHKKLEGNIFETIVQKIVFNAPYDDKHTYHIKIINSSARRIGWAIKTTNMKRLGVDPACGCLDPKEATLMTVSCDAIAFGQEGTNNDRITIEWTNTPDGAAKRFRREWLQGDGMVSLKESVLVVVENIDELDSTDYNALNTAINRFGKNAPFPRLILTTASNSPLRNLSNHVSVENISSAPLELARQEIIEEMIPYATMSPRSPREVLNAADVKDKSRVELFYEDLRNRKISAITGEMAKIFLTEALREMNEEIAWLYVDMLTDQQIIYPSTGFGSTASGHLLELLATDEFFTSSTSVPSTPSLRKFVVFYGTDRIWQWLPIVSSLLKRDDSNLVPTPYLTFFDGSTILLSPEVHCVLCIPDDLSNIVRFNLLAKHDLPTRTVDVRDRKCFEDIYLSGWKKEIGVTVGKNTAMEMIENLILNVLGPVIKLTNNLYISDVLLSLVNQELSDLKGNSSDVLLQGAVVLSANFLKIFVSGEVVDQNLCHYWALVFSKIFAPLPPDVSNWKLSIEDPSTLVRWENEPFHISSMEKEARMADLMVVWPAFDRVLHFGKRMLGLGNNLLVTGPPLTQKTTLMLQKQLPGSIFQWIPSHARVGLENCQREFTKLLEQPKARGEQLKFLVIDKFSFAEPLLPIIELFVDQKLYFSKGEMKKSNANLKFILICEEEDWINISKTHVFYETFAHLPIRTVTIDEAQMLVEKLLQWNLSTKSFSSEYSKLVEPLATAIVVLANKHYVNFSPLPICMRLVKGMFFSFPDNSPDTLSFIRLWLHEAIRVIGDAIDFEYRTEFLQDLKKILREEFGYKESDIFQLGENDHAEADSPYELGHLLYSELDNNESFDGLNYLPVKNMVLFNRTVENILFEHHRNHSRDRIQLAINDFSSASMQCVLRILRQAGEHACLAGEAGIGRQQIAKMAAAACGALILHHYPNPSDFDAFRKGWADIFIRAALAISSNNQPVLLMAHMDYCVSQNPETYERVEPRWMEYVRLWLENPEFGQIGDEQLIAMGEQIIENEKSLVSHMQSQGIRLPGRVNETIRKRQILLREQRIVRFLPIEVLKEPDVLRHVLESRVHDLLHVVFTVQPHLKTDFSWCSVIHFKKPKDLELDSMCFKLLVDLQLAEAGPILMEVFEKCSGYLQKIRSPVWTGKLVINSNILYHLCDEFQRLYSNKQRDLHYRARRLSEALNCITKLQDLHHYGKSVEATVLEERISRNEREYVQLTNDFHIMGDKVDDLVQKVKTKEFHVEKLKAAAKLLEEEIETKLKQPREDFQAVVAKLSEFGPAQFKHLSLIQRPGLGCRFVGEVLRHLLQPNFNPKRNTMDTWQDSQKFLRSHGLLHKLLCIQPMLLDIATIRPLKKYIEHREFKETKIEGESELAAILCQWTYLLINLTISVLIEKQAELNHLKQEITETENRIVAWKRESEQLQEDIMRTEKSIHDVELSLTTDRKIKDYQTRAGPILEALAPFYQQWRKDRGITEAQEYSLFSNCILRSVFSTMLVEEDLFNKTSCIDIATEILKKNGQTASVSTVSQLMNAALHDIFSSRHFTLLIDENRVLLPILERLFSNSTTVDMSRASWTDPSMSGGFVRHIYSGTTTIYHNLEKFPPVEYYEVLQKWEQKEVRFMGRHLELPDDCRLLFVTQKRIKIEPQLRRIVNVMVVNEPLGVQEPTMLEHTNSIFELLTESSAAEILESHELTRRVIIEAENMVKVTTKG